jgi:pilus assembly protein CpaF
MSLLRRIENTTPPPGGGAGAPPPPPNGAETATRRPLVQPVMRPVAPDSKWDELKTRVQNKLVSELDPKLDLSNLEEVRRTIEEKFQQTLDEEGITITRLERQNLFEQIVAEILGHGPIEPLLQDDTISEVMVNGPKSVWIEQAGKLRKTDITFQDNDHVMRVIDRILSRVGRRCDESVPYADARLPDGSRVNVIIPPCSLIGPVITIRKFKKNPLTVDDMIRFGTYTPELVEFLKACVQARLNIIVSGGTGTGKTVQLNIMSSFIPNDERIITIEDAAELQLRQEHVISLEARPPNIEGKGAVTIRDLVRNALRMRPERIVVGECRGGEAFDMLQAMNTGHEGSMTTLHANSPRDALRRLETLVLQAGMDLPLRAIRETIASAVHLIIQLERMKDGSRKVVNVTEVQGMEGDVIVMQDIFVFEQTGYEGGKVLGRLRPTGIRPKFMDKIEALGINLPPEIFGVTDPFSRRGF